jgi:flavin reductase (DIM6/NTAB) family NADH-FMN oxidoreductase RutF
MTMSAFNSVSVEPSLVLFSGDRRSKGLPSMLEADGFISSRTREDQN